MEDSTLYLPVFHMLSIFILKIVAFILGYLTIKLGYNLIKEGITGNFNFTTEVKGIKGALQSGSPGLLFVLLGVFLIGYAMSVKKEGNFTEEYTPGDRKETPIQEEKPQLTLDTTHI